MICSCARSRIRSGLAAACLALAAAAARADVVKLKSGVVLRGEIVAETATEVTVRESGAAGQVTVRKSDIAKITRQKEAGSAGPARAERGPGAAGNRPAPWEDLRWLEEDVSFQPEGARQEQERLADDWRKRQNELVRAGDANGLKSLAADIRAAAVRAEGLGGHDLDCLAAEALCDAVEIETKPLEGRPVTEEEAIAAARQFAACALDGRGKPVSTRERIQQWYRKACLLSADPYRYDLELRDLEAWELLAGIREAQGRRWAEAEPRLVNAGGELPPYKHETSAGIAADDIEPRPFPQDRRAWERKAIPRNNAIDAGDRIILINDRRPPSYNWHELWWDVEARGWVSQATACEQLRLREPGLLTPLAEGSARLGGLRDVLASGRRSALSTLQEIAGYAERLAQEQREGDKLSWTRRIETARDRLARTRERVKSDLPEYRDLVAKRAALVAAWENERERLLKLLAEEKRLLGRNYMAYTVPKE